MFEVRHGENGEIVLSGRFDASQAERVERVLESATGTTVVDFLALEYISSLGLAVLLRTQKRLVQGGGGLRIVGASPHIREIFKFSGLDRILPLEPS